MPSSVRYYAAINHWPSKHDIAAVAERDREVVVVGRLRMPADPLRRRPLGIRMRDQQRVLSDLVRGDEPLHGGGIVHDEGAKEETLGSELHAAVQRGGRSR